MKNGRYNNHGWHEWYLNDKLHRDDGPALVGPGVKHWYVNGQLHREDGPATDYKDGGVRHWVHTGNYTNKSAIFLVALSKSLNLTEFYK